MFNIQTFLNIKYSNKYYMRRSSRNETNSATMSITQHLKKKFIQEYEYSLH